MALPSFTDIASQQEFKDLPTEKKAELTETYWNDYAKENPDAGDYVQGQRQRSLQFLDTRQKLNDAAPIARRFFEAKLDDEAFDLGLAEGVATGVLDQTAAQTAVQERQAEVQPRQQSLQKLQSLFTPEVDQQMQPAYKALEGAAVRGGVFGSAPFSTDLKDVVDRVITPGEDAEAGPRVQNEREYKRLRDTFATDFGLEPAEVDSLIQHRLDLQPEAVSRDPAGTIHIKSELLAQHPNDVRKAVLESNLPWDVKKELNTNLPQRIDTFKTQALATARKNYPELATELGIAQPSDDPNADFEKLTKALNDTRLEQFQSGGQAGLAGTGEALYRFGRAVGVDDNPAVAAIQDALGEKRRSIEGMNALSADLNRSKTQIFGTDAAVFGQAAENIGEAIAIGVATAGLGELFTASRIAGMAPRVAALAGAANRVAAVSPIAALSAGKQGIQTYENALQAGKTPEEATDLAWTSAGIEFAVTAGMSGLKMGGVEDVGGQITRQGVREAAKEAFPEFIKGTVKGITEEQFEEQMINALDTALVQTKINPNLTNEDFMKSVRDTALVTLAAAGPASAIGAASEARVKPTHEMTTEELEVAANKTLVTPEIVNEPIPELPSVDEPTAAQPGANDLASSGVPPVDAATDVSVPAEGALPPVEEPSLESAAPTEVAPVEPSAVPTPTEQPAEPLQASPETPVEVAQDEPAATAPVAPIPANETENQVEETSRPAPVESEPAQPVAEVQAEKRTPQRESEGEKRQISAKNAATDKVLEDAGLPPIAAPARKALGTTWDEAQQVVAKNPKAGSELVRSLNTDRVEPLTDVENGVLLTELAKREEDFAVAQDRLFKAAEAGNESEVAAAQGTLAEERDKVYEARLAAKATGTAWGRSGRFRQVAIDEDYSLIGMENRVRTEVNDGKPLSNAQVKEVADLHKTISELQGKVREFETRETASLAAQTYENALRKLKRDAKNDPTAGERRTSFIQDQAAKAKERIAARKKEGRLYSAIIPIPPQELLDYSIVVVGYLDAGIRKTASITSRLVKEFGENIRPHAKQIIDDAKRRFDAKLPAPSSFKSPEEVLTAISPEEPITGRDVYDLARAYINNGIEGFENVMNAVHAELVKTHPDLTIRDVHDAFSNYGRTITPSKADDKVKLREYRNLARLTSQLEDAQKGLAPKRTGLQRDPTTERVRTLQKEVKDEMRRQGIRPTSATTQLRSSLDSAKTRLRNEIEELETSIRERKPRPEGRSQVEYDQEAKDLRTSRDKLRSEYQEIFGKKELTPREQSRLLVKSMTRRIAEGDRQLAAGILSRVRQLRMGAWSPELAALQRRLDAQKEQRAKLLKQQRPTKSVEQQEYDALVKSLSRRIAEGDRRLAEGLKSQVKSPRMGAWSPELAALQTRLDEQRAERQRIRTALRPSRTPEEIAYTNAYRAVERNIEKYQQILDSGKTPTAGSRYPAYSPTNELLAMIRTLNSLKTAAAELRAAENPPLARDVAKKRALLKTLAESVGDLERRVRTGDVSTKAKGPGAFSGDPLVDQLRESQARLRKTLAQMKRDALPKLTPEEARLRRDKKAIETRIRKLRARIETDDYDPPIKPTPVMDTEKARLQLEELKAKEEFNRGLFEAELKKRTRFTKVLDTAAEIVGFNRTLMTIGDVSAVLRQGGLLAFGNPVRAAKAIPEMFRAGISETQALRIKNKIEEDPNYVLSQRAKLFLSDFTDASRVSKMEEEFRSRWAKKVPGLKAIVGFSERTYNTFLNVMRMQTFSAMVRALARNGEAPTLEEAKTIANFVNIYTGRGNLGKNENAAAALAAVFFSPKYVASRFQILTGLASGFRFGAGNSLRTRKAIATEYAKTIIGLGLFYGLYSLAADDDDKIEWDPRSSDFGKFRVGNTRIDPLSGLAQTATFLSRLSTGQTKTGSGAIKSLTSEGSKYGDATIASTIGRFVQSKLAPLPGAAIAFRQGEDVVGQPVSPAQSALGLVTPLALKDVYESIEAQGVGKGTALGLLALFGMGVQNRDAKGVDDAVLKLFGYSPPRKEKGKSTGPKAPKPPQPPKPPKPPKAP